MSETLGKLASVTLVLLFELGEVAHADAAVAADAMGKDLATVEQLVKVRAAHAEAFGGLIRRDRLIAINDDDFVAGTNAAAQAQQQVTQLRTCIRARELVELVGCSGVIWSV